MAEKIQRRTFRYLEKRGILSGDEIYLHLILMVAYVFAALVHLFLLVEMSLAKVPVLIAANVVSLGLYLLVGFGLVFKGRYFLAGLLVSLEVLVYSFIMVLTLGSDNYSLFYPLLLIVLQIVIPYAGMAVRSAIVTASFVLCILLPYFDSHYLYDIGSYNTALCYFNITAGTVGIIMALLIGNVIRSFISAVNLRRMEDFENQAHTDQLTGLFNRRYARLVFDRIRDDRAFSEGKWCVAMLDIDEFKRVNDAHGHAVGDEVLIFLAGFLKRNLRKNDIVFRWGGEEVLILLEDIENQVSWTVLDKIRARLAQTVIPTTAGGVSITVTIGVAELDVNNIDACIGLSDERLYAGKQTGKNKVVT